MLCFLNKNKDVVSQNEIFQGELLLGHEHQKLPNVSLPLVPAPVLSIRTAGSAGAGCAGEDGTLSVLRGGELVVLHAGSFRREA